jgi:Protein of unknown function (DUF4446)
VPELTTEELTLALAVVAGVALLSFLIVLILFAKLRRMRREYRVLRGESGDRDLVAILSSWAKRLEDVNARVEIVNADHKRLSELVRRAVQRFHIVRYDAFEDMGGRMSFSAALLDDHGDGVVITSINGRTETRTYAKAVRNLASDHNLSDEEGEAIAGAVAGEDRTAYQPISR